MMPDILSTPLLLLDNVKSFYHSVATKLGLALKRVLSMSIALQFLRANRCLIASIIGLVMIRSKSVKCSISHFVLFISHYFMILFCQILK